VSTVLGIDTTGQGGSLALARDGAGLGVVHHDPRQGYAESLFPLLDALLGSTGLGKTDVDAVAVVRGPGSFTGLRIGIMMAKSLAYAREWPLWTADALPLLFHAEGAPEDGRDAVLALLDAGAGCVYAGLTSPGEGQALREPARLPLEALETWAGAAAPAWRVIVPDSRLHARVRAVLPPSRVRAARVSPPLASVLAALASQGRAPAHRVPVAALVPLYLSPSQAERARGLDLRESVHQIVPPTGWE
jgi:tRNA threonylcarbamoyladenosine biosynthesis protein TsaB